MKTKPYTLTQFYADVENIPLRDMTMEETELLLLLYNNKSINGTIKEGDKPFLYKVIEKRLAIYSFTITDPKLLLFLCGITQTPGKAVLYLTYLDYWCKKNNITLLTFDCFCKKTFPHGFPDFDKTAIWEKFKSIGEKE